MIKLFYLIILSLSFLKAEYIRDDLENFFDEPYLISETDQSDCLPSCRRLSFPEKYQTKIIDFDAVTGVTTCEVFSKTAVNNLLGKLSVNANTQIEACIKNYNSIKINYEDKDSLSSLNYNLKPNITELNEYEKDTITMSRFIGGLATLDDDVIDIVNSRGGTIDKRNPEAIYNINNTGAEEPNRLLNSIDKLSTNNLSYYVDLFYSMDKIYEYMVAYVFVFISLFFMLLYSSKIALKKIAKKTTAFDEPWQSKIAVIVFTTVIFFIPMKLDNEYSSILFQNI